MDRQTEGWMGRLRDRKRKKERGRHPERGATDIDRER